MNHVKYNAKKPSPSDWAKLFKPGRDIGTRATGSDFARLFVGGIEKHKGTRFGAPPKVSYTPCDEDP